ncbi:zinc finger protein [Trichonephila inaurata madagascariensis]|uniref:Zinc finger protein n=1 Tax=Trichonephila inaurata madagascariensis TaxID=2747483 RepID=A0A8X7BUN4_9ARAC|nr:zinc finger protein [Trichonephila inaurata madagascariensis]
MNLPLSSNHEVKDRKYNNNDEQLLFVESTHHKKKPNSEFNTIESSETHLKCYKRYVACAIRSLMGLFSPYEQHLQGKAHKKIVKKSLKNVGIDSLLPATDSTLQNSMQYNSGVVKKYYCEICKKQCTCPIQYDTHILSIAHKNQVLNSEINGKVDSIKEPRMCNSGLITTDSLPNAGANFTNYESDKINSEKGKRQVNYLNSETQTDNTKKFPELSYAPAIANFNFNDP